MKEAYIIDGLRTAIGNFCGSLSTVRVDDLGAMVIKALTERNPSIPLDAYDDVIFGCGIKTIDLLYIDHLRSDNSDIELDDGNMIALHCNIFSILIFVLLFILLLFVSILLNSTMI